MELPAFLRIESYDIIKLGTAFVLGVILTHFASPFAYLFAALILMYFAYMFLNRHSQPIQQPQQKAPIYDSV